MSSAKRCFVDTLATTRNSFTLENGIKTALSLFSIISKHSNVLMPEQLHHRWVPSIVSTELYLVSIITDEIDTSEVRMQGNEAEDEC